MSDVTEILHSIQKGDPRAAEELLPLVYGELRKLAAARMAHENPGQTLQPTALVHEAYLRLVGPQQQKWDGRGHFFAAAAQAMRRILVDNARRKLSQKRGGSRQRVDLDQIDLAIHADPESLGQVNEALEKLEREDPIAAKLVELRFFVGLTNEETAQAMNISERTAKRIWAFARAWLYQEMKGGP